LTITSEQVKRLAGECGFELAGVASALPSEDLARFESWRTTGYAGEMTYLTDRRGDLRSDPRNLLSEAKSIVCVGKLYNTAGAHTDTNPDCGWISRYAWGLDYHDIMRRGLAELVWRIPGVHGAPFESRICVDTAPLLERSYARAAGLGWIGKNTCLISQQRGSWFFLGEVLLSLPLQPDSPPPDRCGTCRRCIDACPTAAIVPGPNGNWTLDSRLCISYVTIEKHGAIPEAQAAQMGNHVFGCDICQDVCPWNSRADTTQNPDFQDSRVPRQLDGLAAIEPAEFRSLFRDSPVSRAKYEGFLRNVAVAMGNSQSPGITGPLVGLAAHPNPIVAAAALQAMNRRKSRGQENSPALPPLCD
jgi:epoxyqueuosine reductase